MLINLVADDAAPLIDLDAADHRAPGWQYFRELRNLRLVEHIDPQFVALDLQMQPGFSIDGIDAPPGFLHAVKTLLAAIVGAIGPFLPVCHDRRVEVRLPEFGLGRSPHPTKLERHARTALETSG